MGHPPGENCSLVPGTAIFTLELVPELISTS